MKMKLKKGMKKIFRGSNIEFKKQNVQLTEIKNEAWHYRYVGKDIAKKMYDDNLSFEEYYAMYLDK